MTAIIVALIGLTGTVLSIVLPLILNRPAPYGPAPVRPPRPPLRIPKIVLLMFIAIMVVGVAGVALFRPPPPPPPAPEVRITRPAEGASVRLRETISGTSRAIPESDSIWVVIFIPSVGRYFPQDHAADRQAGGGWNALVQLGTESDAGLELQVLAVTADVQGRDAFRAYLDAGRRRNSWPGLDGLPTGVREHHRVTVTRS